MFLNDDFLLNTSWAKKLFHGYAEGRPIIDYHCHLNPREIYEDGNFSNIAQAWLGGDHYKWRLMRACGVPESHITGSAPDFDKFMAFAETLPKVIGNPIYVWTHLELRRFFGIHELICPENAAKIWEKANAKLAEKSFSRRSLVVRSGVKALCTTDDPADDLAWHRKLAQGEDRFAVLPTYRPDKYLNIDKAEFSQNVRALAMACGSEIESYEALLGALAKRASFFHEVGCRLSDHGLDMLAYQEANGAALEAIFQKAMAGAALNSGEIAAYRSETLSRLIALYREKGWVMQLHFHASRNCNSPMLERLGPDTGYDAIEDGPLTASLKPLLDRAEKAGGLCKTIFYSLNEKDTLPLAALMGCYQGGGQPGKMQLGSGWWYNDTFTGMTVQLRALSELGALGGFVGMLTDSRSFLSYTRHEYFRRVLCRFIGEIVERGEAPGDEALLGGMVENICYKNAQAYFGFGG